MTADVVIIGAGQAGLQLASSLRELGHQGRIRLVGDEPHAPYQRPPLSKAFLAGSVEEAILFMQEPSYFADHDIEFLSAECAVAVDRGNRRVELASGRSLDYGHLVFATGTRNRPLPCPGAAVEGVVSLRTLQDARLLKTGFADSQRIVVLGAGFLGLEAATIAAAAGRDVLVVEAASRVLSRVVSRPMSSAFQRRHEARGVRFLFDDAVVAIHARDGRAYAIELRDGQRIPADLVLVSIGVVPNAELAAAAGLAVRDGIVVDDALCTADPLVSAIGDCASFPFAADGGRMVRLESVQNAVDQARCLARRIMGEALPYDEVPLFWSDQAGLRLQIAGLSGPEDVAVVRGDPLAEAFSVFCYRDKRLVGVELVNRLPDHMTARKLLRHRHSPSHDEAADLAFDLKKLNAAPVVAS